MQTTALAGLDNAHSKLERKQCDSPLIPLPPFCPSPKRDMASHAHGRPYSLKVSRGSETWSLSNAKTIVIVPADYTACDVHTWYGRDTVGSTWCAFQADFLPQLR